MLGFHSVFVSQDWEALLGNIFHCEALLEFLLRILQGMWFLVGLLQFSFYFKEFNFVQVSF
jgi:hypothetical protein